MKNLYILYGDDLDGEEVVIYKTYSKLKVYAWVGKLIMDGNGHLYSYMKIIVVDLEKVER